MNNLSIAIRIGQIADRLRDNVEADMDKTDILEDIEGIDALTEQLIENLPA